MTVSEKYRWKYRLLASVDIVGSTAFKNGQAQQQQSWAHVFEAFFQEFPSELDKQLQSLDSNSIEPNCARPTSMRIWKFVGDEILFHVELGRHEEVLFHAIALKKAVNEYGMKLAQKHPGLELKATLWGAGFPVSNVEVVTTASHQNEQSGANPPALDFLGPNVDLGFRLAQHANRRRLVLSAEIALLIFHARKSKQPIDELHLFLDPPREMKGFGSNEYPILWLDRGDGEPTPEDILLGRERKYDHDAMSRYLNQHFSSGFFAERPFIENDPSMPFKQVPLNYNDRRKRLIQEDSDRQYDKASKEPGEATAQPKQPPLPKSESGSN